MSFHLTPASAHLVSWYSMALDTRITLLERIFANMGTYDMGTTKYKANTRVRWAHITTRNETSQNRPRPKTINTGKR